MNIFPLAPPSRIFILAFLLIHGLSLSATAQNSDRTRGDSLRMAGDLTGAAAEYARALANNADDADAAYALGSTFALHGQFPDSAFHYLSIALHSDSSMRPLWDPDLYFLIHDSRWKEIEDRQLDKLAQQLKGTFHREYARKLLRIRLNEWGYRYHIMLAYRQLEQHSPLLSALGWAMSENHRENEARLEALIDRYGWPEHSAVGEEAAYAAGNVVNHADLSTRQRYLPMIKAVCERGEGDWSEYAHILDRIELELGNPQVFGTQMELNESTGQYNPRPMVDPDRVDERRADIGMEPIATQLARFNFNMKRDFGRSGE